MTEASPQAMVAFVDDDADLRNLVRLALESAGFPCVCAGSCREALERLAGRRFHALLLDQHLGDGDGVSLLAALRDRGTEGPCVFLTGDAGPQSRARLVAAGAWAVVEKPFDAFSLPVRLAELAPAATPATPAAGRESP